MFSIFLSLFLRSLPVVLFALLCSKGLALQISPISLARRLREMGVRINTWAFKVQANLCRNMLTAAELPGKMTLESAVRFISNSVANQVSIGKKVLALYPNFLFGKVRVVFVKQHQ